MAFIDARDLPANTAIQADLILIGGGMAGITMAREFANTNIRVAVLEGGGRDIDPEAQALYAGYGTMRAPDNPDREINDYLHQSRARLLGGSGNIWGGKCVPLDASDFEARSWLPRTGWPVTRRTLQPYYDRACRLLEIPLFDRDWDQRQEEGRPPLVIDGAREFFSSPRNFTALSGGVDRARFDRFRTEFAEAPNINVYLNANVVAFRRQRGRRVERLEIACTNGKRHTAEARTYVLGTGGIENARLLLASRFDEDHPGIGRNFMGHVTFGVFAADRQNTMLAGSDAARNYSLYQDGSRDRFHCVIAATTEGQRRRNIGNFTTTLVQTSRGPNAESQAVLALAGGLAGGAQGQALPCFFMSEQLPHPDSRISLIDDVDALGVPRVRLDWVYTRQDMDNLERAVAALGDALGAANLGRVCFPASRSELLSILNTSRHHIGTTRIATHRDDGVVDANCRMHHAPNLYIAGSSVFPTSGIANPTLTLMAMAMRLSDHLKRDMGVR